jgi:hypothetical protein
MHYKCLTIIASVLLITLVAGCTGRPTTPGTPSPTPDPVQPSPIPSNDNNDQSTPPDESSDLTREQKEGIDEVLTDVQALAGAYGTLDSLTDTQLDWTALLNQRRTTLFGSCPQVSIDASTSGIGLVFDFGTTGCTSIATGGKTVSGSASISVSPDSTYLAAIDFNDLTIAGQAVSGGIDAGLEVNSDGVLIDGSCSITTAEVGTVSGEAGVLLGRDGTISIVTASLAFVDADGAPAFDVTLDDIVVDAVVNQSVIPESGTASFEIPNPGPGPETWTVVITFTAESPTTHTVLVSIEGAPAFEYEFPDTTP